MSASGPASIATGASARGGEEEGTTGDREQDDPGDRPSVGGRARAEDRQPDPATAEKAALKSAE